MQKQVFVFGNSDVTVDALPLRLLPKLRATFEDVTFETLDPNEEWNVPEHMCIIDTVVNVQTLTVFHDLHVFMAAPRISCHDFDAYANLMLMKKIGKIQSVTIIGMPPGLPEDTAFAEVSDILRKELT